MWCQLISALYHTVDDDDIECVHIDQRWLESTAVRWRGSSLVDQGSAFGAEVMAVFYYIGVYSSVMDLKNNFIKTRQIYPFLDFGRFWIVRKKKSGFNLKLGYVII